MRKTKRVMLLAFVIMISMMSCNNEELFEELVEEATIVEEEVEPEVEEEVPNNEDAGTEQDTSLPCEFTSEAFQSGDTVIVNCILDLQGQTINIPANISIEYEGGDIINGALIFSEGSTIDGNLLNATWTLGGILPQLNDPEFTFNPERWDIVEGVVSDAVALKNKEILNTLLVQTKEMGATTFKLTKMDAYFNIEGNDIYRNNYIQSSKGSIKMLSNLDFIMDEGTVLRKQPSDFDYNYFISFYDVDNVTLSGGTLVGDKYKDGKPISEHNMNIAIIGSHNINILGVTTKDAMGDGIYITHKWIRNVEDGSLTGGNRTSENVLIKGCIIDNNARQGISPVDCNGLIVDGNIISNTAKDVGTSPACGMDLEAWRTVNPDGSINEYQRVENVDIINNTFFGNINNDVLLYTCSNIFIDGNTFEKGISNKLAWNVEISNNTMVGKNKDGKNNTNTAIIASSLLGSVDGLEKNYNWNIHDNTITGYRFGIKVSLRDSFITNNTITQFSSSGITLLGDPDNISITGNTCTSTYTPIDASYGQVGITTWSTAYVPLNNVVINNNICSGGSYGLGFMAQ